VPTRVTGGNPLLARVGTYYHDVGKLAKPQYFIENQPQGRNPHDRLKPSTSAAIVRGHVAEGLRLAEQYRLPESIRCFIREHHGTQSIGFFLDQARELKGGAEPNPTDYAYPGPRPRSKETAILMLADGVESAARVLQDPTAERIRALVDRIIDGKIAQHQLDECPLTMGEIAAIKDELSKVVAGMYHHRIDYPGMIMHPATEVPATTGHGGG
jgi:putative nucleotidyltransferase with HDIG domain